jgi:excisionase family DNA binding protein
MNKEDAASELGISVRTLQRYMSAHRLAFTMKRTKTGEVADFAPAEVERFRRELAGELTASVSHGAVASEPVSPEAGESTALVPVGRSSDAGELLALIYQAARSNAKPTPASVPIESKPLLTIAEAHALTGLSDGHLREAIHAGRLKGKIIGRGYRIKRADLDKYIGKL